MKIIFTKRKLTHLVSLIPNFSLFLAFLFFPFSSSLAQEECSNNVATFGYWGNYELELIGVEYDYPEVGQSTWYYTMTAKFGRRIRNISIPLNNDCIDVVDAGTWGDDFADVNPGGGYPRLTNSCWWGYRLHFRQDLCAPRTRNYYFTIDQNLEVEAVCNVYLKAGCYYYGGTVCGPSPECNETVDDTPPPPPAESCISGLAFHDSNKNGVRDADESMIENVSVSLRKSDGTLVDQMPTATDGTYSFCGLDPDSYIIQMDASFEYFVTQTNIGDDDSIDNDLESMGHTGILEIVVVGDSHVNVDGGYFKFGDFDNQTLTVFNNNPTGISSGRTQSTSTNTLNSSNTNSVFMNPMGDNSFEMDVEVKVFPNPVVDRATFKVANNDNGNIRIEVRTQSNQLIRTTQIAQYNTEASLGLSDLARGAYFVYFISDNGVKVETIIKK